MSFGSKHQPRQHQRATDSIGVMRTDSDTLRIQADKSHETTVGRWQQIQLERSNQPNEPKFRS